MENALERENRYALTQEENRKLKQENRLLREDLNRERRRLRQMKRFIDKLQEAIVRQALMADAALAQAEEEGEEMRGESGE